MNQSTMDKRTLLLKNKNFLRFWLSHLLSQISTYTVIFLLIGRTFELTTSSIATGLIWIAYALPNLVFSPFSGSLVDRMNNKRTLIFTYLGHSLIIFLLGLNSRFTQTNFVYPLLFLYSTVAVINDPAELAELPNIIKKKSNLLVANNLFFFTDQTSLILSSTLGALLLKFISLPTTLFIAAGMPLLASLNISTLVKPGKKKELSFDIVKEIEKLIEQLKKGYKFLEQSPLILYSFLLIIVLRNLTTLSLLLLPNLSKNVLNTTAYDAGYLVVLPLAIGLFLGTTLLTKNNQEESRKKDWIGKGFIFLSFAVLGLIFVRLNLSIIQRAIDVLFSTAIGVSFAIIYAPAQTFIQENTPNQVRGHTFSNLRFVINLVTIPATIIATSLAEFLGIKVFMTIISLAILGLGLFVIQRSNEIILSTNNRA
jgi:MFS family permease